MDNLLRESFVYTLTICKRWWLFSWTKKIILRYEEGLLCDLLSHQIDCERGNLSARLLGFVDKYSNRPLSKLDRQYILKDYEELHTYIKQTYFLSVFNDLQEDVQEDEAATGYKEIIERAAHRWGINPVDVPNTMSLRQLRAYLEGSEYNINAQTEDGQKKNRLKAISNRSNNRTDQEQEEINAFLSE